MKFPAIPNSESQISVEDDLFFDGLRQKEYCRLDKNHQTYLDYTGGNLYAESQIINHRELLLANVFGNPHSSNPTSGKATELIEETREKILEFFNAQDYICVFTQNATGALKIIGESYPFNDNSCLVLLADNHNSVNGIREYCHNKKGTTIYVPVQHEDLQINEEALIKSLEDAGTKENKLFAYPAQSNVSGVKHDLKWIEVAHQKGFDVLLDAAAYVSSSRLDLSKVKPDYVCISFYKIFGYPTGIGCLLIKKSSFSKLVKPWFAGGTVSFVSVVNEIYFLTNSHERFEDGTLNYLDIPAVKIGLDYIESIGIERITKRVHALIETLTNELKKIVHDNGKPIVKIFGPENFVNRGGNIIINFFDAHGNVYPNGEFEKLANKHNISIRSGCFCNPGIDEINNCVTNEEVLAYFVNKEIGSEDYDEFITFLKDVRGATRVSVGLATTSNDLAKLINLIKSLKNKDYM